MKLHVIFIGNKFIYDTPLKDYVLRSIEKENEYITSVIFFKESDNSLFLYLEKEFNSSGNIIIISSKQNFTTLGKLICTVTTDNQVLQDSMLIPQKASVFEDRTYLLEYNNVNVNVIQMDENQKMPQLLLVSKQTKATIHIFNEDMETLKNILTPIAQTYDIRFNMTQYIKSWIRMDIFSSKYGDISNFIHASKKLLPSKLIPSSSVVEYIIDRLASNSKKITFAESCTGGLLSYYFTKRNGASKILDGSLITYSNNLKENWLAVSEDTLKDKGAVSFEVVAQMSEGSMNVSDSDYAISISGIAGDTGGTKDKPVGTVYIGVRSKTSSKEEHIHLFGDRNYIQHQSAMYAIKMLLDIDKETFF
jgi:nicotinamide-nucleotide amidase